LQSIIRLTANGFGREGGSRQDSKLRRTARSWSRGESVTATTDGEWLHTGDLGEIDPKAGCTTRRKKDMIVTRKGLNVHPEDVEAV